MSLTSDIATMIARYEALAATYDSKATAINAAVVAAIAAVPALSVRYYVDAVNGNDANSGSSTAPLQSIGKALSLGGPGRAIEIRLMSDYVHSTILSLPQNSSVHITAAGYNATTAPNVRQRLTLTLIPNADLVEGDWVLSGFRQTTVGYCSFDMTALEIVLPSVPETGVITAPHYNGVISSNAVSASTLMAVQLRNCTITAPANPVGWILGLHPARCAVFVANGVVFDSTRMAGHWISGFAAGAQVSASTRIMSNLVTL